LEAFLRASRLKVTFFVSSASLSSGAFVRGCTRMRSPKGITATFCPTFKGTTSLMDLVMVIRYRSATSTTSKFYSPSEGLYCVTYKGFVSHEASNLYMVETEFLFGIRADDKWHGQVMEILELFKQRRIKSLQSCASAFIEAGAVLQAHGISAERIEETVILMKHRLAEFGVQEVELGSDDVVRLYELLRRYGVEYFDAMQAAVALGKRATLVTNDAIFKLMGVKTVSFKDLIRRAKVARS